jgi:putative Ca2+/H+ antiporter (TMEM165/GDT1 family)
MPGTDGLGAFLLSTVGLFLAEFGDKSQLTAMALAARYRVRTVIVGILVATFSGHALWVLAGRFAADHISIQVTQLVAGVANLGFAAWTLRGDALDEDDAHRLDLGGRWIVVPITVTFLLSEFGDKTMIQTVTLGATNDLFGTWLGSSVGMAAADLVAIAAGAALAARISPRTIKRVAATAFLLFGLSLLARAAGLLA